MTESVLKEVELFKQMNLLKLLVNLLKSSVARIIAILQVAVPVP